MLWEESKSVKFWVSEGLRDADEVHSTLGIVIFNRVSNGLYGSIFR